MWLIHVVVSCTSENVFTSVFLCLTPVIVSHCWDYMSHPVIMCLTPVITSHINNFVPAGSGAKNYSSGATTGGYTTASVEKSDPNKPNPDRKATLILSGGEGYIDFRIGKKLFLCPRRVGHTIIPCVRLYDQAKLSVTL